MILELPFEDAVQLEEGATFRLKGVGAFVCEDTMLARLSVKKTRASVKRGDTYKFEGTLTVRPSQDRFVVLELTIQLDGKAVSPEGRVRSHVEESNSAVFATEVNLTPEQTALLAAGAGSAKLKLRMAVAED